MNNFDFLVKVLSSKNNYWIVAKNNDGLADSIVFIALPSGITTGIPREQLLVSDVYDLRRSYMEFNIYLNEPCAPFQQGISFYNVYDGFPVDENPREGQYSIKEILINALNFKSDSLYEYKKHLGF